MTVSPDNTFFLNPKSTPFAQAFDVPMFCHRVRSARGVNSRSIHQPPTKPASTREACKKVGARCQQRKHEAFIPFRQVGEGTSLGQRQPEKPK
jgi:hypothetical protein